eukprot:3020498-Rhodomonas_salina.3
MALPGSLSHLHETHGRPGVLPYLPRPVLSASRIVRPVQYGLAYRTLFPTCLAYGTLSAHALSGTSLVYAATSLRHVWY